MVPGPFAHALTLEQQRLESIRPAAGLAENPRHASAGPLDLYHRALLAGVEKDRIVALVVEDAVAVGPIERAGKAAPRVNMTIQ
jgi:hypothetical protein